MPLSWPGENVFRLHSRGERGQRHNLQACSGGGKGANYVRVHDIVTKTMRSQDLIHFRQIMSSQAM